MNNKKVYINKNINLISQDNPSYFIISSDKDGFNKNIIDKLTNIAKEIYKTFLEYDYLPTRIIIDIDSKNKMPYLITGWNSVSINSIVISKIWIIEIPNNMSSNIIWFSESIISKTNWDFYKLETLWEDMLWLYNPHFLVNWSAEIVLKSKSEEEFINDFLSIYDYL